MPPCLRSVSRQRLECPDEPPFPFRDRDRSLFGAVAVLREDFTVVTARDDIDALIEIVNERQSGKGLAEQVAAADAGAYQGLLDLAELVDQLAERVARLEYRQGDTRSADFASQLTDLSETVGKLKKGLRRAAK